MHERRIVIVGGGLLGLATARAILDAGLGLPVVLEKETVLCGHQSGHNSGVLHAGLYYKPGSLKARLAVSGVRRMIEYCRTHAIDHEVCGKLVVATNEAECARLRDLEIRGKANGLTGLRLLSADQFREIEPHAGGMLALHVPEEGIVSYPAVGAALAAELHAAGAEIRTGTRVISLHQDASGWTCQTDAGDVHADLLVNAAGLQSDRVARLAGLQPKARIVAFRGDYMQLRGAARSLVRNLIYPVPDPQFPFLGVHFTRQISGGIEAGPNAALALHRERYGRYGVRASDALSAFAFPGLWRFLRRYPRISMEELATTFSPSRFLRALRKLVPELDARDLEPGGNGIRAQAMLPDGTLVNDFLFERQERALHVLNAPSPGATASLVIGEHIAAELAAISPPPNRPVHMAGRR